MSKALTESEIELAALEILEDLGYQSVFGPDIGPDGENPERASYADVVLVDRLRQAVDRLNPSIPQEAKDEAAKLVLRSESPDLTVNNQRFHKMLVDGMDVEYRKDGRIVGDKVWLVDYDHLNRNEFLAVNQFTVIEDNRNRRPDIVLFINGLPLAVLELKNIADENASTYSAFKQFQTYKAEIPSLFHFNEMLIASDGIEAKAGTITSDWERFVPWKTIDGIEKAPITVPQIEVMIRGMLNPQVFLELFRHFTVFEQGEHDLLKKTAAYHQYYAVKKAVESTKQAVDIKGDRRCGVVWHTQGSGKSLSMVFYAGKLILAKELENPTIVVLTDRNDLDDQLFGTFSNCYELLRQDPVQANSREELKEKLKVASGGIVFTTIQKFFPENKGVVYECLSERRNIVVIADEAHRSQYDFIDGFARHMRDALPNASFIGFTGTPIETHDKNTRAVFGDEIDIYDIEQAIEDGATVPIYYENRLVKLDIEEAMRDTLDLDFEEATEGQELSKKELLKSKWARMEAIVGSEKRINQIAEDIVEHFEERLEVMDGKAMIVCMSRRIAVELHNAIVNIRPDWYSGDDDKGAIKVIMTGSADDGPEWQEHIRNKERRRDIGDRIKDPKDPLKMVIVRDMWLTGFDVPCLHTMYLDKPMRGHGLMQAIARVNRVFKGKPGGLVVDYLGIAAELKKALVEYTQSGGKGKPTLDQEEAVAVMLEKFEIVADLFHGFDYQSFFSASTKDKMSMLAMAQEHILQQDNGKERCLKFVTELSKAFALAVPHPRALKIRDDVGFFQAVRACLAKLDGGGGGKTQEDLDSAVQQLVSKAVSSDQVIDIFATAGLDKPDISVLSDQFLAEVKDLPQKNLAVEVLRKLLNDEIKVRARKNLIQGRSFADMLEKSIRQYQNKAIKAVKVIEELIQLAKKMKEADRRGEDIGLNEDELAFYDALEVNDSAVQVLGDETLREIARELVETVRRNITIDWTLKESIQARLRVMVKRILKKYGYPPDKQKQATLTVLEQATMLCKDWTAAPLAPKPSAEGEPKAASDLFFSDVIPEGEDASQYVPVYSLAAACGKFAQGQEVEQERWLKLDHKVDADMFVVRAAGHSMEPKIKDGAYCLFKANPTGPYSGQGRVYLFQYQGEPDPDTGGAYSIKCYRSHKNDQGINDRVELVPLNKSYDPLVFDVSDTDINQKLHMVGELVEVLGE